ncbi:MAG: type II toxin-antitoxin system RelE/ParE family toxin [Puniceicoccaceae bacterium]
MRLRILSAASRDLLRGKRFYEKQSEGLGDYFLDSLFSDIDSLIVYAGIHRKFRGYFCLPSKRFPYAVYYRIESEEIRIFRIIDCRQNPSKTARALPIRESGSGGDWKE